MADFKRAPGSEGSTDAASAGDGVDLTSLEIPFLGALFGDLADRYEVLPGVSMSGYDLLIVAFVLIVFMVPLLMPRRRRRRRAADDDSGYEIEVHYGGRSRRDRDDERDGERSEGRNSWWGGDGDGGGDGGGD
ncbi:MAG: hypothetical protein AAFS07_05615 [Pseudomonadota bacterium]